MKSPATPEMTPQEALVRLYGEGIEISPLERLQAVIPVWGRFAERLRPGDKLPLLPKNAQVDAFVQDAVIAAASLGGMRHNTEPRKAKEVARRIGTLASTAIRPATRLRASEAAEGAVAELGEALEQGTIAFGIMPIRDNVRNAADEAVSFLPKPLARDRAFQVFRNVGSLPRPTFDKRKLVAAGIVTTTMAVTSFGFVAPAAAEGTDGGGAMTGGTETSQTTTTPKPDPKDQVTVIDQPTPSASPTEAASPSSPTPTPTTSSSPEATPTATPSVEAATTPSSSTTPLTTPSTAPTQETTTPTQPPVDTASTQPAQPAQSMLTVVGQEVKAGLQNELIGDALSEQVPGVLHADNPQVLQSGSVVNLADSTVAHTIWSGSDVAPKPVAKQILGAVQSKANPSTTSMFERIFETIALPNTFVAAESSGSDTSGTSNENVSNKSALTQALENLEGKGKNWNHRARVIQRALKEGFNLNQAVAMVGNFVVETGGLDLSTEAIGDGGTSKGLAQWHLSRKTALEKFAKERGKSPHDFETQLDFLFDYEFNSKGTESAAYRAFMSGKNLSVNALTKIFCVKFERPGSPYLPARQRNARSTLADIKQEIQNIEADTKSESGGGEQSGTEKNTEFNNAEIIQYLKADKAIPNSVAIDMHDAQAIAAYYGSSSVRREDAAYRQYYSGGVKRSEKVSIFLAKVPTKYARNDRVRELNVRSLPGHIGVVKDMRAKGYNVQIGSSFRSAAEQKAARIGAHCANDTTYVCHGSNGEKQVAPQGMSKHQTGKAVDYSKDGAVITNWSIHSVLVKVGKPHGIYFEVTGRGAEAWHGNTKDDNPENNIFVDAT